jgi:anhydro-N-acetylmuramic acid kinase
MMVLGLMSGTSMDGVDAAMVATDGEAIAGFGPRLFRPYADDQRALLRAALADARAVRDRGERPGAVAAAEAMVTAAHADAVAALRAAHPAAAIDLVGFHGQTVLHAPGRRLTLQIGDGAALARAVGVPVVFDFRAADVAAGGEGAPLVPVYHAALVARAGLRGTTAVVNLGGVANLTRIDPGGGLIAGDTGPGNALLDDLVRQRTGAALDEDGRLARAGRVDEGALAALLDHPWFARPLPKSLDRNAFSLEPVAGLATADAAATLVAFTAAAVARGLAAAGGADQVILSGGGARNPVLVAAIAAACRVPVKDAGALGWSADFIEAEAFAYLAARSLRGLPLSFPGTTGVPAPTTGGRIARP